MSKEVVLKGKYSAVLAQRWKLEVLGVRKEKNPTPDPLRQQPDLEVFPHLVILVQFAVYFVRTYYSMCRATGQMKLRTEIWWCY